MSKQMLNEQTFTAANIERIGASGDRTMSVNGVIARTIVLFAVTVVFGVIGWTRAEGVLTGDDLARYGFAADGGVVAAVGPVRDPRCRVGVARVARRRRTAHRAGLRCEVAR